MEETGLSRLPPPGEEMELSVVVQSNEQTPLTEGEEGFHSSAPEEPSPAQAKKDSPWSVCNKILFGKCRVWMAITSIFLSLIILIIIGLCLVGVPRKVGKQTSDNPHERHESSSVTYIDEDENDIPELSSNKTFLIVLKIPDECITEQELPDLLTERLTDVYNSSPLLSRYFASVERADTSAANDTISYQLLFGVPAGDALFMEYVMSEEVVLNVLRQNFHDKSVPGCKALGLDPVTLVPTE